MTRRVDPAPAALRDLDSIRRWLRQPGAGWVAREKLRRIRDAIGQLRHAPCRWPEGDHPGVREIPVEGYRILYEVDPDTSDNRTAGNVRVLRVFGPGQDRTAL